LTYFKSEGKNLVNIDRDFALNEMILRTLTLKVDPKLVDTMLALARDEHALALQTVAEGFDENAHEIPMDDLDSPRGGRRGRRND
jgi:small subunit ribosomal protein S6